MSRLCFGAEDQEPSPAKVSDSFTKRDSLAWFIFETTSRLCFGAEDREPSLTKVSDSDRRLIQDGQFQW
ncbi:hypothetical protein CBR_g4759 [Chara braunii]|uniref:Uncharacterized protein n=1 Tax=Chara braunii TaxID=69332 RepID=A0A388KIQ5_CHABU|nr:hypothetical protein CBR_g4759 [Chara braunii]|eukprot:GBG69934.1 hypothetical protein CBR_g4759 [Chara braunii]